MWFSLETLSIYHDFSTTPPSSHLRTTSKSVADISSPTSPPSASIFSIQLAGDKRLDDLTTRRLFVFIYRHPYHTNQLGDQRLDDSPGSCMLWTGSGLKRYLFFLSFISFTVDVLFAFCLPFYLSLFIGLVLFGRFYVLFDFRFIFYLTIVSGLHSGFEKISLHYSFCLALLGRGCIFLPSKSGCKVTVFC